MRSAVDALRQHEGVHATSEKDMKMEHSIRAARPTDLTGIEALLPRLAEFEIPTTRVPEHLWQGDRDVIRAWATGDRPDVDVVVVIADDTIVGVAAISARKEMLSGEPSAHLEVLALGVSAEGLGIGSELMHEAEAMASRREATCMSLHVFAANTRARALYERHGYDGELMRYFKRLD